jgi:S-formylglutathione hydrolase FrmB
MSRPPRLSLKFVCWLCLVAIVTASNSLPTAAKGRVLRGLSIPSPTLGRAIPYTLYRPGNDDRAANPRRRLPVLYLLHGHGDDETAWLEKGRIAETLDRLIAAGRIAPLMVVMPMAGDSWYVDDARGHDGFGAVAHAMASDLVAGIDARYRTDACRERRAIGGLSMGGFGAVLYAFDHPDMFTAAISLSGSLFAPNLSQNPERRQRLSRLFGGVYGQPFDMDRFNRWNVFVRVERVATLSDRPAVWLAAGDDDFPAILRGTVELHLALRRAGVATELRVDNAGHTWRYWSSAIIPALKWLSPRISGPCGGVPDQSGGHKDTAAHE